jgi:hypothetical protein
VTGTELGTFLQYKVINYSYETQHPQFGKIRNPNLDKGDFIFVLPTAEPPVVMQTENPVNPPPTVPPVLIKKEKPLTETGELKVFSEYTGDLYVDDVFYQTIVENATVLFFNIPTGKHLLQFYGPVNVKKEVVVIKDQTCVVNFEKN